MFCAVKGPTSTPASDSRLHKPAATRLLPTSDAVPSTAKAAFTVASCSSPTRGDEVRGQGGIGPEKGMNVAQQSPIDHESLRPGGAAPSIGPGLQAPHRRPEPP